MIVRIVKMSFRTEQIESFRILFSGYANRIRTAEGCTHLELWNDTEHPEIFFTYSHWVSQEYLEGYRNSELFREVWTKTKQMFNAPAEAWSVNREYPAH